MDEHSKYFIYRKVILFHAVYFALSVLFNFRATSDLIVNYLLWVHQDLYNVSKAISKIICKRKISPELRNDARRRDFDV